MNGLTVSIVVGTTLLFSIYGTDAGACSAMQVMHCKKGAEKFCMESGEASCWKPNGYADCICPNGGVKLSACQQNASKNTLEGCKKSCGKLSPSRNSAAVCGQNSDCFCSVVAA